jgi:hypothetical protein
MNAAVTRLFTEAGIQLNYGDETITVNNPAKASVAMLFYKSMGYLQKTPYLTMLKSRQGRVKIFEANQKFTSQYSKNHRTRVFSDVHCDDAVY